MNIEWKMEILTESYCTIFTIFIYLISKWNFKDPISVCYVLQKGESNNVQKVRGYNFFALCDYEHEIVRFLFKEVNKSWKTGLNIHCLKSSKTKLQPFLQYTMFGTNLTSWRCIVGAIITLFCVFKSLDFKDHSDFWQMCK